MLTKKLFTAMHLIMLIGILIILPVALMAQAPGFEGDTNDVAAPIDGGVGLLVAAGVSYRIHKKLKAQKSLHRMRCRLDLNGYRNFIKPGTSIDGYPPLYWT